MSIESKLYIRKDWPESIAIRLPEGWAIYGGVETDLERSAALALEQPTESDAWDAAKSYYDDMTEESQ